MRVVVSGRILDMLVTERSPGDPASDGEVWKLHKLFTYACERRHVVVFDPPSALDRCLETFDPRTRAAYARALHLSARDAAKLPANAATVRVEAVSEPRWDDPVAVLPLDSALAVLREPLGILVENADNDWSFLLGLMRPSERQQMLRAVSEGWATPVHGGGATLRQQLDARLNAREKGLRTFVMFDSDRLHPDEFADTWTPERPGHRPAACQAFEWEQLTRAKLPSRYWMLRRRFIESYMPQTELPQAASQGTHPDAAFAFHRMSQDERWYFNMKKGFDGDDRRHDKDRCRALFSTIDSADREALRRGFGDKLADHYSLATTRELDWDPEARREASQALPRLMRLL